MKKIAIILSSLLITMIVQGQSISQPQSGAIPSIKIGKPKTFQLENGLKVIVVENHKLPRVSFTLTLDNPPYIEGAKKGVSNLLDALIGNGTKTISKVAFNEEIDFLGATINFSARGAVASTLSKYARRVLELMAQGVLKPNFTQEEFDKEKAKQLENLQIEEKSVPAVASRVRNFLTFGKNHPFGEYVSQATLQNVTLADVEKNYNTCFVPENAYLIVVGDVKFSKTKSAIKKLFGSWQKAKAPAQQYEEAKDVAFSRINFIDMPNAVQSDISLVNLVNLKMTDPDYFAALLANQIFGGDFNSYINMNLREKHGWTYGAGSKISGDKYTTKFQAATQVRNEVTDSVVVELLKEHKKIRTKKVSEEMLDGVKASYIGQFVMQTEKPQTIADFALKIKTQNLPEDFYENYIKNINAVTIDEVMKAANKYFLVDNTRIVIVGKGTDVLPALEKLRIPMFIFDKYGNPVNNKPVFKKRNY